MKRYETWLRPGLGLSLLLIFLASSVVAQEKIEASRIAATVPKIERLKSQLEQVSRRLRGDVGIAVKHLETDEGLAINGDEFFPLASVFKVPILVEVMAQVKEGRFSLDDRWEVGPLDLHLGSGLLSSLQAPGISLSVRNIIYLMMLISDNSATDLLLTRVGAENVNRRLQSFGVEGITVNRTCQQLILDYRGVDYEKYKNLTLEELQKALTSEQALSPQAFERARKEFSLVMKDQATPSGMTRLLELIATGKILDKESCDFIIDVMLRCQTGERRLRGDLPPRVRVAHKTGTIGGTVNDAGIIFLPYNLGRIAITVFVKNADEEKTEDVEDVIAQIARFVYDYFLFGL